MKKYLKLLRVNQWIKNLIVFLPLFFSGNMLNTTYIELAFYAFLSLCFLTSGTYIFNDIVDIERDKHHPEKRNRAIASGDIPISVALGCIALLLILAMYFAIYIVSSEYLLFLEVLYLVMMILYTLFFKHLGIIDAIVISIGFVLRVLAGAIILEIDLSAMLVVAIIGAAILISFGKRKAEISSIGWEEATKHRPALSIYPKGALDSIISTVTSITFFAYILYSYTYVTIGFKELLEPYLPPRFHDPQWLLLTIPFAFYVLARYLVIIYQGKSTSPEEIWVKDLGLRYGILIWGILLFLLIYFPQLSRMF